MTFGIIFLVLGVFLTGLITITHPSPQVNSSCDTPNGQVAHCGTFNTNAFGLGIGIISLIFGVVLLPFGYFNIDERIWKEKK